MQWVVSADEVEKRLLSGEWTEMTDLEIDQFLATPELCEVDANGSLQERNTCHSPGQIFEIESEID